MGVDYSGNYGVGIKIIIPNQEEIDDITFVDDLLEGTDFEYFEVGSSNYTGGVNDFYVCIVDPFKDGYDIRDKVEKLLQFLSFSGVEAEGKVDQVGGLNIH